MEGVDSHSPERGRLRGAQNQPSELLIPKNRSASNLLTHSSKAEKGRIRFSFDAGMPAADLDSMSRLVGKPLSARIVRVGTRYLQDLSHAGLDLCL